MWLKPILYFFFVLLDLLQLVPWYQLYLQKSPTHQWIPSVDMFQKLVMNVNIKVYIKWTKKLIYRKKNLCLEHLHQPKQQKL